MSAKNFFKPVEKVRVRDFLREFGINLAQSEIHFGETLGDALATKSKDFEGALKSQLNLNHHNLQVMKRIVKARKEGKPTEKLEKILKQNTKQDFDVSKITPSVKKSILKVMLDGIGVAADTVALSSLANVGKKQVLKPEFVNSRLQDAAAQIDKQIVGGIPTIGKLQTPVAKEVAKMSLKNVSSTDDFIKGINTVLAKHGFSNNKAIMDGLNRTVNDFEMLRKMGAELFTTVSKANPVEKAVRIGDLASKVLVK